MTLTFPDLGTTVKLTCHHTMPPAKFYNYSDNEVEELGDNEIEDTDDSEKDLFLAKIETIEDDISDTQDSWKLAQIGTYSPAILENLQITLSNNHEAFAKNDNDVGECQVTKHSINIGDSLPFKLRAYRTSPQNQILIDTEVERLLNAGIIEESDSSYASPGMLINKKDGTKRWVIDYRKLNSLTRKDSYTTPVILELLDDLGGA